MRLFVKTRQKRRAGRVYTGPACWCDDYSIVPRPCYYALTADGKTVLPHVPLVCVDDAPGDHLNGACHYEHAGPKDMPQRRADRAAVPAARPVNLEAHVEGTAEVSS